MPQPGDVVADGRVDREKRIELLALGAEQEALDFKATLDFYIPDAKWLARLLNLPLNALHRAPPARGPAYARLGFRHESRAVDD